ncbi:MAG TPA: FtsQ-type POTRA domain-containing protein [Candidatus Eisenbacteria bacterium]|nr:FtsQ-type POTRA domain-containing protein [Candidatus Eisenbacteria bacterium]
MVTAAVLAGQLINASIFSLKRLDLPTPRWTDLAEARARLGVPLGMNVFSIRTAAIEASLEQLPAVADARVSVALPDGLQVRIGERKPVVAWSVGGVRYLVDAEGAVFGVLGPADTTELDVPIVVDIRPESAPTVHIGGQLDVTDLDAGTRLGAVTPVDLGSAASSLAVGVGDVDGFTLTAIPDGWVAVFGPYSPALRATDLIPGQVRLLRSQLHGQEAAIARVILADDRRGTFVLRSPAP